MIAWLREHWKGLLLIGLTALLGWFAFRAWVLPLLSTGTAYAAAAALAAQRRQREREIERLRARERAESDALVEAVLTEQERRRLADDEIAGPAEPTPSDTWDKNEKLPLP